MKPMDHMEGAFLVDMDGVAETFDLPERQEPLSQKCVQYVSNVVRILLRVSNQDENAYVKADELAALLRQAMGMKEGDI